MSDLLGIVGSRSHPSKTRAAVQVALDAAEVAHGVETRVLHLADYDIIPADGRSLDEYTGDTADALQQIIESRAYIIGTPVYRASYAGVLKNLFDMIPRGMWQADVAPLANVAVGLIATGATPHHYLAVEKELAPLLAFFGAYTVGSGVYVHGDQFTDYEVTDPTVSERLQHLGAGTIDLARCIAASPSLSALGPQF